MLYNVRLGILHAHYDYCQQFLNSLIFDLNKTPQCSGGNTNSCHWISDSGHDFGTLMSLINVTSPFIGIMNYILPIANRAHRTASGLKVIFSPETGLSLSM